MKDAILAAAASAPRGGALDQKIYSTEMIEACGASNSRRRFLDLHIRKLIALRVRDFYPPGSSWREAVNGLTCDGWEENSDAIERYFTSDLEYNLFPAPGAKDELRIGFTGAAAYCKLGNHRVVAAKAWLAAIDEGSAILKQANCYYTPVNPVLKPLMEKCLNEEATLKLVHIPSDQESPYVDLRNMDIYKLVLWEYGSSKKIYIFDSERELLKEVKPGWNPISRILERDLYSICECLEFQEIPVELMKLMIDDSYEEDFAEHLASRNIPEGGFVSAI